MKSLIGVGWFVKRALTYLVLILTFPTDLPLPGNAMGRPESGIVITVLST